MTFSGTDLFSGTWNYYGLMGNFRRLSLFYRETCRMLHKWLNRRSQRRSTTWRALHQTLQRYAVPPPRIVEQRQRDMPCQKELSFCQRLTDVYQHACLRRESWFLPGVAQLTGLRQRSAGRGSFKLYHFFVIPTANWGLFSPVSTNRQAFGRFRDPNSSLTSPYPHRILTVTSPQYL